MAKTTRDIVPETPARLRELREAYGLTAAQLAGLAGTGQGTISSIETAARSPSWRMMCAIADALRVPLDSLRQPAGSPIPRRKNLEK